MNFDRFICTYLNVTFMLTLRTVSFFETFDKFYRFFNFRYLFQDSFSVYQPFIRLARITNIHFHFSNDSDGVILEKTVKQYANKQGIFFRINMFKPLNYLDVSRIDSNLLLRIGHLVSNTFFESILNQFYHFVIWFFQKGSLFHNS